MAHYSLNEIDAYARRAARGAGMAWGLAEETGRATRWLSARGMPGVALLVALLTRNDGREYATLAPLTGPASWRSGGEWLCPICTGAAIEDRAAALAGQLPLALERIAAPLFLAPFLAQAAAASGDGYALRWPGACLRVGATTWEIVENVDDALLADEAASVNIERCASPRQSMTVSPATELDTALWARLAAFAQRTYVPASEVSRVRGAGATGSDND